MKVPQRYRFLSFTICLALAGLLIIVGLAPLSAASSTVLISAVYYDTYLPYEPDESFRLINASAATISLSDWTVSDGEGTITLTGSIDPGASLWIAKTAVSFTLEFGFPPAYEYGNDSDPTVPDLARRGSVALANSGDELMLRDGTGAIIDSIVWEGGDSTGTGWNGAAIAPYDQGFFGIEGQILYRKIDQQTGRLMADTDTVGDWAQGASLEWRAHAFGLT